MAESVNLPLVVENDPDYYLFPEISHVKKRAFLTAFARVGALTLAGQIAGVDERNHYYWLKKDPQYTACFEEAKEIAADGWEDECTRRAFHGTDKPVYYKGEMVDTYKEFSDTLAMFMLNGTRSEKFHRKPEAPNISGPVLIQVINYHGAATSHNGAAPLQREELSTAATGRNGFGYQESGPSVASKGWQG